MTDAFVEHLERSLGAIQGGWTHDASGSRLPFSVARFHDTPAPGARTLVTLGLSHTPLLLGRGPKRMRQELLLACSGDASLGPLPGLLQQLGTAALRSGRAYSGKSTLPLDGPAQEGSIIEALYLAAPIYFPDQLHVFAGAGDEPIVTCWLVPITGPEAKLAANEGWEAFEDRLAAKDPDLLDWSRKSII